MPDYTLPAAPPDWMGQHPEFFCWAHGSDPENGSYVTCDRVKDHRGPHSWEPWQPGENQRGRQDA